MILVGEKAVEIVRKINGDKNPIKSELGSIRGRFAIDETQNLVHASDSTTSAEREISIWFPELNEEDRLKITKDLFAKTDGPLINV